MGEVAFSKPDKEIESELPMVPMGWRVLIRPFKPKETTESGLALPDEVQRNEEILTNFGQIVAMGDQCFKAVTRSGIDMAKIANKPKVGDWVMYGSYGGQQFFTKSGVKYTVVNDDSIMGVVPDPHVFRVYI